MRMRAAVLGSYSVMYPTGQTVLLVRRKDSDFAAFSQQFA